MSDRLFYETFEDELNAIRVNLYEKVKHRTADERIAHLDEQTAPVMEEFGIRLSTLKPVQPRKRERVGILNLESL